MSDPRNDTAASMMPVGGLVLDTPDSIMHFHMLAQKHALRLEIAGLKHSSGKSVCAHIKRTYGITARSKKEVLAQFTAMIEEKFPTKMPVV